MSEKINYSAGINPIGLLGVAFIILKLCGVINWSWWWVLAPFWGGFVIALVAILVILFCAAIADLIE